MFEIISSEESVERAQEILENIESCCELTDDNELWYDIAQQCVTEGFEGLDREQVRMTYGAFESVVEAVRFNCGKNAADGLLKATVASFNEYIEYKNTIAERYDAEDNAKAANYNDETLATALDRDFVKKFSDEFMRLYGMGRRV